MMQSSGENIRGSAFAGAPPVHALGDKCLTGNLWARPREPRLPGQHEPGLILFLALPDHHEDDDQYNQDDDHAEGPDPEVVLDEIEHRRCSFPGKHRERWAGTPFQA